MPSSVHTLRTQMNRKTGRPIVEIVLQIDDLATAGAFIDSVVQEFSDIRMMSPQTANQMVIAIYGPMSAAEFRDHWYTRCAADPALSIIMTAMTHALVLKIQGEEEVERISLLQP